MMFTSKKSCSNRLSNISTQNDSAETLTNSKYQKTPLTIQKHKKIMKKTNIKKRGYFSLQQVSFFSDSTKINQEESPKKIQNQKPKTNSKIISFSNSRKKMSFSFFSFEEDKIEMGKFNASIHNPVEDNDIDTDVEILENALWNNFQILNQVFHT